jgi:hypothetical protein
MMKKTALKRLFKLVHKLVKILKVLHEYDIDFIKEKIA